MENQYPLVSFGIGAHGSISETKCEERRCDAAAQSPDPRWKIGLYVAAFGDSVWCALVSAGLTFSSWEENHKAIFSVRFVSSGFCLKALKRLFIVRKRPRSSIGTVPLEDMRASEFEYTFFKSRSRWLSTLQKSYEAGENMSHIACWNINDPIFLAPPSSTKTN